MQYGDGEASVLLRDVDEALLPSHHAGLLDPEYRLDDRVRANRCTVLLGSSTTHTGSKYAVLLRR